MLLTQNQDGTLYSLKEKTTAPIPLPVGTRASILYAGRIYALTPDSIFRLTQSGAPPTWKQSAWIEDGTAFSNATAMTIDGNIYVATPEGVLKFTKGKKTEFTLEALDVPLVPFLLFTHLESQSLYLFDQDHARFVIIEKHTGALKKQLDLSEMNTSVTSFVVDETKKLIYFHADNKIIRVGF